MADRGLIAALCVGIPAFLIIMRVLYVRQRRYNRQRRARLYAPATPEQVQLTQRAPETPEGWHEWSEEVTGKAPHSAPHEFPYKTAPRKPQTPQQTLRL